MTNTAVNLLSNSSLVSSGIKLFMAHFLNGCSTKLLVHCNEGYEKLTWLKHLINALRSSLLRYEQRLWGTVCVCVCVCLIVCDLETWKTRRHRPEFGCCITEKKKRTITVDCIEGLELSQDVEQWANHKTSKTKINLNYLLHVQLVPRSKHSRSRLQK